jgi:acetyltransferase
MAFWTEAQMASIDKMLNPRSIAIVGATPRMQYGGRFLAAALKAKDRVRVYAVNPRYDDIMGVRSYPSVTSLPEAPDVVAIVVPWDQVLDVLQESSAKGAGSAVVISAGFAERGTGDRRDLQRELGEFARASGMRISGPNCLGLANVKADIWATASSRGAEGLTGPIGLVCQSGATAFGPFLVRAVENGIGFSYIISTGNEADLDFTDFARYLLDDPETRVIAGFVEGFKRADKFLEVAKLAAERGKPIVLIKIGRSELGAQAARSHTAALTGADARYDAIFAQYGVIRVQDYDELLEVAHLLAHTPRPQVPGIAVVSHSGGISSLTADMCGQAGLDLPSLGEPARDGINGILKGFGWAANPADVTGFANSESFPQIMAHMVDDPRMGTLVVASAGADAQAQQVTLQRDRTDKGVVFLWTGSRDAKAGLPQLKAARIPIFYTPDKLARGLKSRLAYHTWRERRLIDGFAASPPRTAPQDAAIAQALGLRRPTLSESESKEVLAAWGVASAREHLVASAEAAVAAAERLGFPVALKVDSPDILHKTEAGVVRLNLADAAQVRAAYAEILANAEAYAFKALPLDGGGLRGGDAAASPADDREAEASPPPRPSPIEGEGEERRMRPERSWASACQIGGTEAICRHG